MKTKRNLLISFISLAGVITLLGMWVYKTNMPFDTLGYMIFGSVILIIALSLYFKINSFKSEKVGLTAQDELSKGIKEKAAAKSFNFSIYMWIFGILFLVDIGPRAKIVVGLGVIVMALFFLTTWLYLSKVGISDENKN
jgi:hypothetical protein